MDDTVKKIILPKLGESIHTATIIKWLKKENEFVEKDEALLEVATDKVNSEIPSSESGILIKILKNTGDEVEVGETLCLIDSKNKSEAEDFFSPAVLKLAKENNISIEELKNIPKENRLSKKDLENYISSKKTNSKKIKMSHMRKSIADNMVRSFYQAPHASLISEVDVTNIVKKIKDTKDEFFEKNRAKLTITSFIAKAITKALMEYPLLNSSLDDDTIILKDFIHLGVAVNIENGLLVPVIKDCDKLSIEEIAKQIFLLKEKAKSNKLTIEDMKEGSITLTNFGISGVQIGIPIIKFPEVAIVGVGAISKKVVVIEEDQTAIRSIVNVSLTFDHRVIDGIYGCGFLNSLKIHLEKDF